MLVSPMVTLMGVWSWVRLYNPVCMMGESNDPEISQVICCVFLSR